MRRFLPNLLLAWAFALVLQWSAGSVLAGAEDGWVIRSFDVRYVINADGTVEATEDIRVDFGTLERHGIFRDIPVEYAYNDESNRLIGLTGVSVNDGAGPVQFEVIDAGPNLRIKIGDPDTIVRGEQRYVINYTINDGLNPFADHDELYWNVTGNDWAVPIESASAVITVPAPGIERLTCFEGPTGSTAPCVWSSGEVSASFRSRSVLERGSGLTLVVGLRKGLVSVGPPILVPAGRVDGGGGETLARAVDLFDFNTLTIGLTIVSALAVLAALARHWWTAGRDRWLGDNYYISADAPRETIKPLLARETIVVEYQPPELPNGRRLRPAEIGILLDERADTLDVTATIVHLAVRRHLVIKENLTGGIFGLFQSRDYELLRDSGPPHEERRGFEDGLKPYESKLLDALFETGSPVQLSDLKNTFHDDLAKIKSDLYEEATTALDMFPGDPEAVRTVYRIAGAAVAVGGGLITFLLGNWFGGGLVGLPVVAGGGLLFLLAHLMPRRTASGRQLYRRCLGFRLYMTKAEKARQEFAEKANLFEEYLPYAIVYGCVEKWAKAFEGLELDARPSGWYVGQRTFAATSFADSLNDFSSSISGVMASTPGGSGGSGFGGSGSSGGGGGGGGGGSW
jgi:uncharacterized membrane protein YgcG